MARLGLKVFRCSVEWARIEPEEGEFSAAALAHYARVLDACAEHGLTPMVTLHHFTSPRWFAARGGWEEAANVPYFGRFTERVLTALGADPVHMHDRRAEHRREHRLPGRPLSAGEA